MSTVTSEQLVAILEEKLEQKLAPFKMMFDELKKSVVEAKELLSFTANNMMPYLKNLQCARRRTISYEMRTRHCRKLCINCIPRSGL